MKSDVIITRCKLCGSDNVEAVSMPPIHSSDPVAFCVDCGATVTNTGEWSPL